MKRNLTSLLVLALLAAGYVALVALSSSLLPERVAIHFGANGRANNWTGRSQTIVLFETLAVVPVFFVGLSLLMRVLPTATINLPQRDYWLAPERRSQTVDWISGQIAWLGCINALLMAGIYWLTIVANNLNPPRLPMGLFVPLLAAFLLATGIWIFCFFRHFAKPQQ
jgi:uncharacterized membrane protein